MHWREIIFFVSRVVFMRFLPRSKQTERLLAVANNKLTATTAQRSREPYSTWYQLSVRTVWDCKTARGIHFTRVSSAAKLSYCLQFPVASLLHRVEE